MSSTNPDYSTDNIEARVAGAATANRDHIERLLSRYELRRAARRAAGRPVVAFCGRSRAGKDTAAEYFCAHTGGTYAGSSSRVALPIVAAAAGHDEATAWEERHQHPEFWIASLHEFRRGDLGRLARMALAIGDVAAGIRGRMELEELCASGVVDLTVWICNPRVPEDPTLEYDAEDCDVTIPNRSGVLEFYAKIRRLVAAMKVDTKR